MATIRTQEQLETIFSNNRIPEGSDFADLIATIFERMTPTEADSRYPTKTAASNTFATKNYVDSALGSIDFSGLANDCNGIIFGHKKDYTNYKCSGLIPFTSLADTTLSLSGSIARFTYQYPKVSTYAYPIVRLFQYITDPIAEGAYKVIPLSSSSYNIYYNNYIYGSEVEKDTEGEYTTIRIDLLQSDLVSNPDLVYVLVN